MDLEFGLFDWVDAAPGLPVAEVHDTRLRVLAEVDRGGFASTWCCVRCGCSGTRSPRPFAARYDSGTTRDQRSLNEMLS
jgi:hypothetical protein